MPAFVSAGHSVVRTDALYASVFGLAYFAGAEVGYSLSLGPSVGGTFWPPAGIALAVFLAAPLRLWPQLLAAGALANFLPDVLHGQQLPAAIAFAIANLSEPLLGALVLRRMFAAPVTLTRLPELAAFAIVAAFFAAPLASAIGAAAAERWTQDPPGFTAGWLTWWVGDAVGALVLAPCVLRIIQGWPEIKSVRTATWLEAGAFAVVVIAVTHVVFSAGPTSLAMPFLVFPVLLWGSLRFGPVGVGAALCLVVLLTSHDTAAGFGPFAAEHLSLGDRLVALQIYIGVMAVSFHALAVLWEERAGAAALRAREEALSQVLQQMAEAQTHREQLLEAERFARGEAERASQLKDEFLATLSHELRTPLNAILGWAHILRRSGGDPTLVQGVDTIERNARAQAKLIDDLLDMSRIMAGKVGLNVARLRFGEIVAAAADALRPTAEAKGVKLKVDVREAASAWVTADAGRLQQVVVNLLGNGIKFTPAGGEVALRAVASEDAVQLVIRDTGQGIPREFMPYVFERFRQADGSITRRHGGLGLGLSIAKQIVEMHGGSIAAQSEGANRGAVFTVTLPLAAQGAGRDAGSGERADAVSLAHLRVLVVDDEADARELLLRLLVEQGCEVEVAESAEEALVKLAAGGYDVLLSDIGMPGTDGYDLVRHVRAAAFAQPKAIAVTAFARPQDRDRALAAGFDGHLAKPVSPARLLQTLAQVDKQWRARMDSSAPAAASAASSVSS